MKEVIRRIPGDLFQGDVVEALKRITTPIVSGVYIEDIVMTVSTKLIPHGLGRPFKGYIVVKQNSLRTFCIDTNFDTDQTINIPLKASGDVTISLWVF